MGNVTIEPSMQSRWNSQILPIAETAISHAFAFSDRFGSLIKILSSDNITENHKKKTKF